MNALITGASSGIGREMAKYLSELGYDIYIVARRENKLLELKSELKGVVIPLVVDLGNPEECFGLYKKLENEGIDVVINNAGMGVFGEFSKTELEKELNMIDVNIKSLHILTKLFLNKFIKENRGHLLNVSSTAGFMMGPLFSSYYASKAYVLRLSQAIKRELTESGSNVKISVLCPGPVKTEFDSVANVNSSLNGISSTYVARYAIKKMLKGKFLIIPGFKMKIAVGFSKYIPDSLLSKITYICQSKKNGNVKKVQTAKRQG